jgi:hypothetical protein
VTAADVAELIAKDGKWAAEAAGRKVGWWAGRVETKAE